MNAPASGDTSIVKVQRRAATPIAGAGAFKFALALIPLAGLFFLWFIAVARERLGGAL